MPLVSLRGRAVQYDSAGSGLYINGSRVGGSSPTAFGFGNTYYVDSGVAGSDGTSPASAMATLLAGNNKCTANQGDTVVLLPGHAENVAAATALTIAGVRYIGLGEGDDRPTITFDTANTASYTSAVANLYFENIVFVANFLSIAAAFVLSTAKGVKFVNCEFRDTSGVLNFLQCVKSTGAANTVDRLTMIGCRWNGLGTTSVRSLILTANDIDGLTLLGNVVTLARTATDASLVTVTAGVLTNVNVGENRTQTAQTATTGGGLINVGGTTSSGLVWRNYQQTLGTATDILFTTSVGLGAFENRVSGAVGATGFVIPAVDS